MPINHLYHKWIRRIRELRPEQRITQIRNFALLMYGIYQSRSVYLSRIAGKIPGKAKLQSIVKRLDRFLDNPAIRVREWYKPIALQWLSDQFAKIGEIHLIVDGTKVGFGHQLLMVSLAYRKRAIPIAWTWVKHVRGHSTGDKQISLIAYVKTLIPRGATVFLVGDTEFGSVNVLKQLDKWYWYYVLRQKSDTLVWSQTDNAWKPFGDTSRKLVNASGLEEQNSHRRICTRQICWFIGNLVKKNPGAWQPICLTCRWLSAFTNVECGSKRCSVI